MNPEIIEFKSIPEMFDKEISGIKPNTVRTLIAPDLRLSILEGWIIAKSYGQIRIRNTETRQAFVRQISDITIYDGRVIISWIHPSDNNRPKQGKPVKG